MSVSDTPKELRVRCFSQKTKHWRHTHNGKKSPPRPIRRNSGDSASGSSSSGSSQPPSPSSPDYASSTAERGQARVPRTSIKILTWNVDFMAPNVRTRMSTVLDHIQTDVFSCQDDEQPEPCCILLQEVDQDAFPEILENEWIRQHFCVVPTKAGAWPFSQYGNVTLVSRTIPVASAQILEFRNSGMGRHALIVDLRLDAPHISEESGAEGDGSDADGVTVRVANVHLESLPAGTSSRPVQLSATADMLREEGIHAGIVAGDMNAITPDDASIHEEAGLHDAWTGEDEDEEAWTWGHQPPREFPPGRLDKILYTPAERCAVDEPERVGIGLQTAFEAWASDHYGLVTTLRVL